MTPHQLRTFLAVADTESVGEAAARLVVTQSAVSASLAALQRELGVALLERSGRGVRLSAEGQVYAGYARRVLGLLAEAELAARGGADPGRGHVRLAVVPTAAEQVLPAYLAAFRRRHPAARLTIEVAPRDRAFAALDAHEVDLALAGRPPVSSRLVSRATAANELVLVASPELVGARGRVPPAVLGSRTWLLREPDSGTRETLLGYLAEHELAPPTLALGANGAVIAGAVAGLGLTLVARAAVRRELAAGQLRVVPADGLPLSRPWHAVSRPELPAPTALFVAELLRGVGGAGRDGMGVGRPTPRFHPPGEEPARRAGGR